MDPQPNPADMSIDALRGEVEALRDAIADCRHQLTWLVESVDRIHGRLGPKTRWNGDTPPSFPTSPSGNPILPRSWPVRFGQIAAPDHFLGGGWWPREPWGAWSKGVSEIGFSLPPDYDAPQVVVALTLQAFIAPGGEAPKVDILVNGYFLGEHVLRRSVQTLRLRLPASATETGDIVLKITHENPVSPLETGVALDERMLGVGLIMVELI